MPSWQTPPRTDIRSMDNQWIPMDLFDRQETIEPLNFEILVFFPWGLCFQMNNSRGLLQLQNEFCIMFLLYPILPPMDCLIPPWLLRPLLLRLGGRVVSLFLNKHRFCSPFCWNPSYSLTLIVNEIIYIAIFPNIWSP